MERQLNACQTPRSMYLSIFNSFWVIRCLSQCVNPKSLFLPHFCFPLGRPWGNHAKCCMDGKRIRCLQIVSLHVPSYYRFWDTARYLWKKIVILSYPLHSTPPLGGRGFPSEYRHPLGTEKLEWCRYPMLKKFRRYVYSFWRDPRTWQTDRRTDCHAPDCQELT